MRKDINDAKPTMLVNAYLAVMVVALFSTALIVPAHAHMTVEAEQYSFEMGWGMEPPIEGIRNEFVFRVVEMGDTPGTFTGVVNAFHDIRVTVAFGGATKDLDISSDQRPGYYYSPTIPTRIGSYSLSLVGELNGVPIDIQTPIERVESTAVLDFPPSGGASSDQDVAALKNKISAIQQDVSSIKSGSGGIVADGGRAYDFAVLGLSIASAAVVLAIISMVKRR